jgi:hypothetical protein
LKNAQSLSASELLSKMLATPLAFTRWYPYAKNHRWSSHLAYNQTQTMFDRPWSSSQWGHMHLNSNVYLALSVCLCSLQDGVLSSFGENGNVGSIMPFVFFLGDNSMRSWLITPKSLYRSMLVYVLVSLSSSYSVALCLSISFLSSFERVPSSQGAPVQV